MDIDYENDLDQCRTFSFFLRKLHTPPSLITSENYNKYVPVSFCMPNKNITWKLGMFLTADTIHKLSLLPEQIEAIPDLVDWDIISTRDLNVNFLIKYKDNINWEIFLQNEHPKPINTLIQVKEKIAENQHLFYNTRMKTRYYTQEFIFAFTHMIDWKWLCKNIKLKERTLLTFWNKFNKNHIAKYQKITDNIARQKISEINWLIAGKRKLSENTISLARNYVNWETICKYQKKLSIKFLEYFALYLNWDKVSKYQTLSDDFIIKYHKKLNMPIVSMYQNMSVKTIKELEAFLKFDILLQNQHYNKPGTIQVISNGTYYFIVEPPFMGNIPKISYYSAESAEF